MPSIGPVTTSYPLIINDFDAGCGRGDDHWIHGNNRKTETSAETAVDLETEDEENTCCCCRSSETDDSASDDATEGQSDAEEEEEEEDGDQANDHDNDQVVIDAMGAVIRRRRSPISQCWNVIKKYYGIFQRAVKTLVEHKYFQQGLLGAILINTLSMGIEYHNQVIN